MQELSARGAILLFFSEFCFFNETVALPLVEAGPVAALLQVGQLIGFYALFAVPMLTVVSWFGVRSLSGLFLAGCLYGWATEGVIIAQVHEAPPLSLMWPVVGWHAPVCVMVGLVVLPTALADPRKWVPPVFCVLLGAIWSYWLTWLQADQLSLLTGERLRLMAWSVPLLPLGLGLLAWAGDAVCHLDRRVGLIICLLMLPLAAVQAATAPLWGLALLAMVLLTCLSLRSERPVAGAAHAIPVPRLGRSWLWLLAIPASALLSLPVLWRSGLPPAHETLLPALFVLGVVAWPAVLLWRFGRAMRAPQPA